MLKPVGKTGLRPIHNGSNGVAKASIRVAVGETLLVSEDLAEQLKRETSAFKDGEPDDKPEPAEVAAEEPVEEPKAEKPAKATAKTTKSH